MRPLIIFDCDGVLVDTEKSANESMAEYLTERGFAISGNDSRARFQGMAASDLCAIILAEGGVTIQSDALRDHVLQSLKTGITAIPGVLDLVKNLSEAGYDMCVASSGRLEKMRITLGQAGLLPLLGDVLFSADAVTHSKPHPDIFMHAAKTMGYDCANAIVIEDSVPGVQAGVAAGARVLAYCGDPFTNPAPLAAEGAEPFMAMADALALIKAHTNA